MLAIDDFGRVTSVKQSEVARTENDLCVTTAFAQPVQDAYPRVLTAVASRTVSDCVNTSTVFAKDTFGYDGSSAGSVAQGSVSLGHVTSHDVERHDDTGAPLGNIHQFDTTWNPSGNPQTVTTTRDGDGASRTITVHYDPFELAMVDMTVAATGLSSTTVTIARDSLSLNVLSSTDPNGTTRSTQFDGYDRPTMMTITPPGGTEGALSYIKYFGFVDAGTGTPPQRDIETKIFRTAVPPSSAAGAAGQTTIAYLDELGRNDMTTVDTGDPTKYVYTMRRFDSQGRLVFETNQGQSGKPWTTAYGTTYFFNTDGTPLCSVRGTGQQDGIPGSVDANGVVQPSTDETNEIYPTCVQRHFESNTEVVTMRDASSYLVGSPQAGVAKTSYVTAVGRVIKRSTTGADGTRLEHAILDYDRLGRLTSMTRYQDANGVANPVQSSWHYDSLGQLLSLQEPDSALRTNTYSNWGELTDSGRGTLHSVATYDALGRVIHREDQSNGVTDPATANDYHYDTGVNITPQVTPTYTAGRLTQASWPTGSVSLSYDAAGDVNARVFLDPAGKTYVEKRTFNDDGSLSLLDLFAPDTGLAQEEVAYGYDTAGRGTSVAYNSGSSSQTLYASPTFDGLSRVRTATIGGLTNYAAAYTDAGRNLIQQVTISSMAGSRQIAFGTFDPMGRERTRTETQTDANTTTTSTTNHVYDALGRLSSSVKTAGTTTVFNQQFAYDPLGNLLSQTDTSGASGAINTTLTYLGVGHDSDRICHIAYGSDSNTACNVTYDDVGAITSMPTPNGVRTFDYLVNGSVRTIQDDQARADFRYDAFGEVQELDVTMGAHPTVVEGRHDKHYGVFTQHDETMGLQTNQVLLRKIPGPDGFLGTRHGPGGPWVFTFGEERGTRFDTDDGGAFVQDVNYQPFGKPTSTGALSGSQLYSNEQWNDGDYLAAFGISQLGARLYDPAIGRFLSRDPLLIPRTATTTNPYAFAVNDPINESDPSGLMVDNTKSNICEHVKCDSNGMPIPPESGGGGSGGGDGGGGGGGGIQYGSMLPPTSSPGEAGGCPSCTGWGAGPEGVDHGRPVGSGRDGSGGGGGGGSGGGGGKGGGGGRGGSRGSAASLNLLGSNPAAAAGVVVAAGQPIVDIPILGPIAAGLIVEVLLPAVVVVGGVVVISEVGAHLDPLSRVCYSPMDCVENGGVPYDMLDDDRLAEATGNYKATAQPETLSAAEEEAIRAKEAGERYDEPTYNRARRKQIKNEKYAKQRNKQKRGG